MEKLITKPLQKGTDLNFDLQRFAATTVTPNQTKVEVTLADALKQGSTIVIALAYTGGSVDTFTGTYSNGTITGSSSNYSYKEGLSVTVNGNKFTCTGVRSPTSISVTFDTENNSYTIEKDGVEPTYNRMSFGSIQVNGTTLPTSNGTVGTVETSTTIYTITIGGNTYSVTFDSSGNLATVNGTALSNGKVTLNGTEYTFSGTKTSITYEEVVTDITKTKTIDGVTVTLTFDASSNNLKNASGTGVSYNSNNNQFTITSSGKTKTYSASLSNDTVTETLQSAVYTSTVDGVTVTFTYNGSYILQSVTGTGVSYNSQNSQFTIGGKTYSASLSNDTVTTTLESAVYTATVDGVTVTFTYNGSYVLQSITGTGVSYSNGTFTVTTTGKVKTYSASLSNDEVTATLQSAVYTVTVDGVTVTFTYNGSYVLQSVTGTGVTYSEDKFTIGNKTYSASLSNDEVTATLESAVYTATVEGVEITFTFDGSNNLTAASGKGVKYSKGTFKIGNKTYSATLSNDEVTTTLKAITDNNVNNAINDITLNGTLSKSTIQNSGTNVSIFGKVNSDSISNSGNYVSISGGAGEDTITHSGNYSTIYSGSGNDLISLSSSSSNNTINAGAGNDTIYGGGGNNVFVYEMGLKVIENYSASSDKISLSGSQIRTIEVSGFDVIVSTNRGKITVKGGADNPITVIDAEGNETTEIYSANVIYNADKTTATIKSSASGTITVDSAVLEIDATETNKSLEITANSNNNTIKGGSKGSVLKGGAGNDSIMGGKGNDTLIGGNGKDIFIYSAGKDVIADFTVGQDSIELTAGTVSAASLKGSDMVFNIGSGRLTVKDGKDKEIAIGDSIYYNNLTYNSTKTTATLNKNFRGSLTSSDYDSKVITIDASNISNSVTIEGNAQNNIIIGGTKSDSLNGGNGNDTLTGGAGKDTFVFSGGNDVITDYTAGADKIKLSGVAITGTSYSGEDLIFKTSNGKLTVKNGSGKEITVIDADNKTTTQTYTAASSTNARLFTEEDNNFITDDIQLDDISKITDSNYTASQSKTFNQTDELNFQNALVSSTIEEK